MLMMNYCSINQERPREQPKRSARKIKDRGRNKEVERCTEKEPMGSWRRKAELGA